MDRQIDKGLSGDLQAFSIMMFYDVNDRGMTVLVFHKEITSCRILLKNSLNLIAEPLACSMAPIRYYLPPSANREELHVTDPHGEALYRTDAGLQLKTMLLKKAD